MNSEQLENLILNVASRESDAISTLIHNLQEYKDKELPSAITQILLDNLSLIIGEVEAASKDPSLQNLIITLLSHGIDSLIIRDALAAICRKVYESYPDPSGLIQALGIFDTTISIKDIYRKWNVFSRLQVNRLVWHKSYRLGRITEIDPLSDLVCIEFKVKQHLNLFVCLSSLYIAKKKCTSTDIWESKSDCKLNQSPLELDACIHADFIPQLDSPSSVTEALLVPKKMSHKDYLDWRSQGIPMNSTDGTNVLKRVWNNSRSLEELKNCLQDVEKINAKDEDEEHLLKIYNFESLKPLSRFVFAESLAILWSICPEDKWLIGFIEKLPKESVAWSSKEIFVEVTCKLPIKLLQGWQIISKIAMGQKWITSAIVELPLRFWPNLKHSLMMQSDFKEQLRLAANEKIKSGNPKADVFLWLWKNADKDVNSSLFNPNLILRSLNQSVKGEFLRAKKELQKLLMDDQNFQKILMDQGSQNGIRSFVKFIKGSSVLNKGEQQSLLVKIIRIYPEAREIVEERKKVVARRALPKLTSLRSFEQRRLELDEIINTKIPQNSAAIAHARSYGDLRENAEFKAAKDEQRLLMARRSELERGLKEVMATDFSDVRVHETVIPGSSVEVLMESKQTEIYHILGLWDSVPEKKILSYDTPLGRLLIGKKVGDKFTSPQNQSAEVKNVKSLSDQIKKWVNLPEKPPVSTDGN